jgi:Na+:H+ antiporter, NhaA family
VILTKLYKEFFRSEKAGGLILIFATVISLLLANSSLQLSYTNLWNSEFAGHSIVHWVNDGLMTIFFLLIGLELEREIYRGELSSFKNASLPFFGAIGGMLMPATIFLIFSYGTNSKSGAGIPTATDIAFTIGILSLLGNRVPATLKIFLTALAVIDDLGAILIIALFYTKSVSFLYLVLALAVFVILLIFNKLKVNKLGFYIIGGILMWFFMSRSGVHPTITGVLLAFTIPFGDGGEKSTSYLLQHFLHKPVAFLVIPLFALANTGITLGSDLFAGLGENYSLGIIAGLVVGKPLGIFLFLVIGVNLGICSLPAEVKWSSIIGIGFLGGIGFTMSIFISLLAFTDQGIINTAKIAILFGSFIAGAIGLIWLRLSLKTHIKEG